MGQHHLTLCRHQHLRLLLLLLRRRHLRRHRRRRPQRYLEAVPASRARMAASVWRKVMPSIGVSASRASGAMTVRTIRARVETIRSRTTRRTTRVTLVRTTMSHATGRLVAWCSAQTAAARRLQLDVQALGQHHLTLCRHQPLQRLKSVSATTTRLHSAPRAQRSAPL